MGSPNPCYYFCLLASLTLCLILGTACSSLAVNDEPATPRDMLPEAERFEQVATEGNLELYRGTSRATGTSGGEPDPALGYVATEATKARSGRFTVLVLVGPDCTVQRTAVIDYRGTHGRGCLYPRFTRQFAGKAPTDPIRIGQDIDAVTGATLSCNAVADVVRRALRLARRKTAAGS